MNKKNVWCLLVAVFSFIVIGSSVSVADVAVVSNGKSTFTIVLPANAPKSIKAAAEEMQRDIRIATGAKLPIVKDTSDVSSPYISLGATQQAKKSNITDGDVKEEGYRIYTNDGNLYILGPDTADGAYTKNGGTSNGTANGVYTFLEDYLDVRWLGLGDLWLDIPKKNSFTIKDVDRKESPRFIYRVESYMQNHIPEVARWEELQKLGNSFQLNAHHNWVQTVTPDMREKHPDWFAMLGGERVKPEKYDKYYKLETTNPEVVQYFADEAIKYLKKNPHANTFSIAPSDLSNWSQSSESKKYYDPIPENSRRSHPSVTPLVLKFYHDVAQIVEREMPSANLGGYIYSDYLYPPQKGEMKLPSNFYPMIAPDIDYGYTLYRSDIQSDFDMLLSGWSKVTSNLFYYDLPNRIRHNAGLVTPVAPEILNFIFPRLIKYNVKGVDIYGSYSWSESAISNYVRVKMLWDPTLDAREIQHEWLHRAYGKDAGEKMELFYQKLDGWFSDYYHKYTRAGYTLRPEMLKEIYADHYPELEKLYLDAANMPMTDRQKERLQQIGNNIAIMQWRLNNLELLPVDFEPQIPANGKVIDSIFANSENVPAGYYGMIPTTKGISAFSRSLKRLKYNNVKVAQNIPESNKKLGLPKKDIFLLNTSGDTADRYNNLFMLHATEDRTVRLNPRFVDHKSWAATFILRNQDHSVIKTGLIQEGVPIAFTAEKGKSYYLSLSPHRYSNAYNYKLSYAVQIDDAEAAESTFDGPSKTLYMKDTGAPIYIYGSADHIFNDEKGAIISSVSSPQVAKLWAKGMGSAKQIRAELAKKGNLENLLKNADFSSGPQNNAANKDIPNDWESKGIPEHWSTWQTGFPQGTFSYDTEVNHGEAQGGSIKLTGFSGAGDVIQSVSVKPGETYVIRGWVRQQGEGNGRLKIRWRKANGNWAQRSYERIFYPSLIGSEDWEEIEGVIPVPPDASKMVLLLEVTQQLSPEDSIWFDDLELYKVK